MVDGIFIVTSALRVNGRLSVYSDEERFHQTVETIKSIQKYCPSNIIYMVDASADKPYDEWFQTISDMGVNIFYSGAHPDVNRLSQNGVKTMGELISLIIFTDYISQNLPECKRIYKVSGRYVLNDNFRIGLEHEDSFVFIKALDTWMDPQRQEMTGMNKLFEGRLYHMDSKLFESYRKELRNMLEITSKYGVDIEHALYNTLSKYKVFEVDKIGMTGNVAPDGQFRDE